SAVSIWNGFPRRGGERQRRYREAQPEEILKLSNRRAWLRRAYGITPEQVDAMFAAQGGRCAICDGDDPGRSWSVDHDHVTGAVRGVAGPWTTTTSPGQCGASSAGTATWR